MILRLREVAKYLRSSGQLSPPINRFGDYINHFKYDDESYDLALVIKKLHRHTISFPMDIDFVGFEYFFDFMKHRGDRSKHEQIFQFHILDTYVKDSISLNWLNDLNAYDTDDVLVLAYPNTSEGISTIQNKLHELISNENYIEFIHRCITHTRILVI